MLQYGNMCADPQIFKNICKLFNFHNFLINILLTRPQMIAKFMFNVLKDGDGRTKGRMDGITGRDHLTGSFASFLGGTKIFRVFDLF